MKEQKGAFPVLSYLREYSCGSWVDQRCVEIADSRIELLAPLCLQD
jgi:hypothetical protein